CSGAKLEPGPAEIVCDSLPWRPKHRASFATCPTRKRRYFFFFVVAFFLVVFFAAFFLAISAITSFLGGQCKGLEKLRQWFFATRAFFLAAQNRLRTRGERGSDDPFFIFLRALCASTANL